MLLGRYIKMQWAIDEAAGTAVLYDSSLTSGPVADRHTKAVIAAAQQVIAASQDPVVRRTAAAESAAAVQTTAEPETWLSAYMFATDRAVEPVAGAVAEVCGEAVEATPRAILDAVEVLDGAETQRFKRRCLDLIREAIQNTTGGATRRHWVARQRAGAAAQRAPLRSYCPRTASGARRRVPFSRR